MPTFDNSPTPSRIAYILAGGKSSRFGSSKALVEIDGLVQIQRLANQLSADAWQAVAVSQKADEFATLGIRTVADIEPDQGPLAGILSGLIDFQVLGQNTSPWALFTTCDLWMWNRRWSEMLVPASVSQDSLPGLLVHFESDSFLPFPCAVHRDALPEIRRAWESGCRSMRQLTRELGPLALPRSIDRNLFPRSFNTPEELKRLVTDGP